jgi:hypothetical protein
MRKTEQTNDLQSGGFEGMLHSINLTDMIQMECLAMSTRAVRVESEAHIGRIFFAGGQLVHAEVNGMVGEEAFFEILSWPKGLFRIEDGARASDETITKNWESLLMEAAHRHDELRQTGSTVTAFPSTTKAMPHDPISDVFKDPEIVEGIRFTNDGTLLQTKCADPEMLHGTFAYIVQLLQHVGTALGAESLREVQLIGTEQRAVCVVVEEHTTAVITSAKTNLGTIAVKLS